MDDPSPLTIRPTARADPFPLSWYHFSRRCLLLTIPASALLLLPTIADVQRYAKPRYRLLAKHYHPDHQKQIKHCHNLTGTRFRTITRTYRWLMALSPAMRTPVPRLPRLSPQALDLDDLPWALCRTPLDFTDGYHETFLP